MSDPSGLPSSPPLPVTAQPGGEYAVRGDYHRRLPRKWGYFPIYVEKLRSVKRFLDALPPSVKILDVGCGEGVLVEEYRHRGFQISGLDLHYESEAVQQGDLRETDFPDESFDVVLSLDVIEHLTFADQERAVREIHRILKPGGQLLVTVPNLAHFSSRLVFLLTGRLLRTSSIDRHPGDRPLSEYRRLFGEQFQIQSVRGIFPTFPISGLLTLRFPSQMLWWHRVLNRLVPIPGWCFLSVIHCVKPEQPRHVDHLIGDAARPAELAQEVQAAEKSVWSWGRYPGT